MVLLLGVVVNAQDSEYLNKIKSLPDTLSVIKMTNDFIKGSNDNLRLYKTKHFPEYSRFVVQYVPAILSDEDVAKNNEELINDFVIFQFRYLNEGENKDLRIVGTKKYIFSDVRGHFLNLFPFWQKHIDPSANKEELSKKGYSHKTPYYFSGSNGSWKLKG